MTRTASFPSLHLAIAGVLVAAVAVLGVLFYLEHGKYERLAAEHDATLASTSARIDELLADIGAMQERLGEATSTNAELSDNLQQEKDRNKEFASQIEDISDTVGVLQKLSETDKELLQKYSKVYFLNENYIPSDLTDIDKEWLYNESLTKQFHAKAYPFLVDMLEAAKEDGVNLWVVSAYRSFGEQEALKTSYEVTYGSGANAFSADQGYSEHQLGTTVDFTTNGLGGGLDGFDGTPAYQWLLDNAYRYGFTLSYPEGNAYYVYEPWHWRFVGVDLARDLKKADAHFYDWDQRKIDAYLVSIFD
jgi:D-alanyl-D-alanine carboxypeptidase